MNEYISVPKKGGTILVESFKEKPYMTFHDAAQKIGLSQLAMLIEKYEIDFHILDNKIMVNRKDIEKLIK